MCYHLKLIEMMTKTGNDVIDKNGEIINIFVRYAGA